MNVATDGAVGVRESTTKQGYRGQLRGHWRRCVARYRKVMNQRGATMRACRVHLAVGFESLGVADGNACAQQENGSLRVCVMNPVLQSEALSHSGRQCFASVLRRGALAWTTGSQACCKRSVRTVGIRGAGGKGVPNSLDDFSCELFVHCVGPRVVIVDSRAAVRSDRHRVWSFGAQALTRGGIVRERKVGAGAGRRWLVRDLVPRVNWRSYCCVCVCVC